MVDHTRFVSNVVVELPSVACTVTSLEGPTLVDQHLGNYIQGESRGRTKEREEASGTLRERKARRPQKEIEADKARRQQKEIASIEITTSISYDPSSDSSRRSSVDKVSEGERSGDDDDLFTVKQRSALRLRDKSHGRCRDNREAWRLQKEIEVANSTSVDGFPSEVLVLLSSSDKSPGR